MNDITRLTATLLVAFATLCIACGNDNEINRKPGPDTPPEQPENPEQPEQPGIDVPEGYELFWADEFNGTQLNLEDWNIEVNGDGGGNNELQYYCERGVAVGEEPESGCTCLILKAVKESYMGKRVTSGRINTQGKVTFRHGRIDARIKFPRTADGLWPAFWMMGDDYRTVGWPACGEIDIIEMGNADGIRNGTQDRYFNGACHWGTAWNDHMMYAYGVTYDYPLQDGGFHLISCIWDDTRIAMYADLDRFPDAAPYYEMNIAADSDPRSPSNYLHKACFVILNLAVGGDFTGIHDIDRITALAEGEARMYVDYVRIFTKNE